jgi:hypothetical protein
MYFTASSWGPQNVYTKTRSILCSTKTAVTCFRLRPVDSFAVDAITISLLQWHGPPMAEILRLVVRQYAFNHLVAHAEFEDDRSGQVEQFLANASNGGAIHTVRTMPLRGINGCS